MRLLSKWGAVLAVLFAATSVLGQDGLADHKLALQISDNDPQKRVTVLNVAASGNTIAGMTINEGKALRLLELQSMYRRALSIL